MHLVCGLTHRLRITQVAADEQRAVRLALLGAGACRLLLLFGEAQRSGGRDDVEHGNASPSLQEQAHQLAAQPSGAARDDGRLLRPPCCGTGAGALLLLLLLLMPIAVQPGGWSKGKRLVAPSACELGVHGHEERQQREGVEQRQQQQWGCGGGVNPGGRALQQAQQGVRQGGACAGPAGTAATAAQKGGPSPCALSRGASQDEVSECDGSVCAVDGNGCERERGAVQRRGAMGY